MGDSHEGIEERHPTKSTPLRGDPEEELRRFVAQAREMGARAVVLFGSRAIEQHTESSDADVCLIAEGLPEDVFQRRYPAPSGYRLLSVLGFHPQEFLDLLQAGNPLVLDIVARGKVLYDDGFCEQARVVFEETVRRLRLRRTSQGWEWDTTAP